jgi:hypothetical protein
LCIHNKLTPQSRDLFEKHIFPQLIKQFPPIYATWKFYYCVNSRLLLLAILVPVMTRQIQLGIASCFNIHDEVSVSFMSKNEIGALCQLILKIIWEIRVRRAVSVCGLNYRREDQRFGV